MAKNKLQNRRGFLAASTGAILAMAGCAGNASNTKTRSIISPGIGNKFGKPKFKLGMASYTFRAFNLEQTITMTKQLYLKDIELKSMHMPLDSSPEKIREIASQVRKAGLNLYGAGVIYMRTPQDVEQAFKYAHTAGMRSITGVPHPNLLKQVEAKVKQYDIMLAIHNHGPTDKTYPTPTSAYERIKNMDRRMGLCIDIGHTQRCGIDPSIPAEKYADRLFDMHLKDVTESTAKGRTVEMGRGVIDLPRLMHTLIRTGYKYTAAFEFEKDGNNPLPGVAQCVGYIRGILAEIARE